MSTVSVVIPHHPGVPGAPEALQRCVASLKGHTELIVVVNEGIGYGRAVNLGVTTATGDYIVIANNDTILIDGNLQWLPSWNGVTVPSVYPAPRDNLPRSFFCIPRHAFDFFEDGLFDERFEGGYWEDDDLHKRLELSGIPCLYRPAIKVYHQDGGGLTMKFMGEQENFDKNKKMYENKWLV